MASQWLWLGCFYLQSRKKRKTKPTTNLLCIFGIKEHKASKYGPKHAHRT